MLALKLETLGLEEARNFYRRVTRRWKVTLQNAMKEASQILLKQMQKEVPQVSGQLRRSLSVVQISKYSWRVGPSAVRGEYGIVVERGRRPGKRMPPLSSPRFQNWLRSKGVPKKRWFAVAKSIGRKGTEPNPFMNRALTTVHPKMFKKVNKAVTALIRRANRSK